jgi:hypothetical protein
MSHKGMLPHGKPIPSEDIDLLLKHFLEPDSAFADRFMGLVGPNKDAFLNRDMIYQLALVMVCIVSSEQKDSRFEVVRRRFEDVVIFPICQDDKEFQSFYVAAMREIARLETSDSTDLHWAKEWFTDIGVDITNPVDAGLFVMMWRQRLFHMLKLLTSIGECY